MICPYCKTDNRDDREVCYHCNRDLTMLRVIVNKAKLHYNQALEYAERDRTDDAINELQNTLDLDGTMVNAHVVLGTLYAKKEEFDKARDEWNAALESDHRFQKAHDYLNKAEKAEVVFPVIRRLKNLNVGLAVLAGLIFLAWMLTWATLSRPSSQADEMTGAFKVIATIDPGSPDAVAKLRGIENNKDIPAEGREAAGKLAGNIEKRRRSTLTEAREALAEGAPALALRLVRPLNAAGDKSLADDINQVRAQAERQVLARVDEAAKAAAAGQIDSEKLRQIAEQAGQAFDKGSPNRKSIDNILANAEKARAQRVLAQARELAAGDSAKAIVPAMIKLRDENQKLAPRVNEILNNRLGLEVERAGDEIKAMIEKGQLSEARERIVELDTLYGDAGIKEADPRLAPLAARIAAAERRKSYNAAIERYNKKDWEAFLAMSQDPGALATDPVELATLEKMRGEAMGQFAGAMYEWMEEQDYLFESGKVDPQTAGRVAESWQMVYDNLPKSMSYGRAPVMFYAAASYFKLGQTAKAKELIERVKKEYPRSFIQGEVKAFVKQYGGQLGIK